MYVRMTYPCQLALVNTHTQNCHPCIDSLPNKPGWEQYRILESNQLNYSEIGVAPARVARIADALE